MTAPSRTRPGQTQPLWCFEARYHVSRGCSAPVEVRGVVPCCSQSQARQERAGQQQQQYCSSSSSVRGEWEWECQVCIISATVRSSTIIVVTLYSTFVYTYSSAFVQYLCIYVRTVVIQNRSQIIIHALSPLAAGDPDSTPVDLVVGLPQRIIVDLKLSSRRATEPSRALTVQVGHFICYQDGSVTIDRGCMQRQPSSTQLNPAQGLTPWDLICSKGSCT